jgi:hypothetical protein
MRNLGVKGLTLVVLFACLFLFSQNSTKRLLASSNTAQGPIRPPLISITPQGDSPLRILSTSIQPAEAQALSLQVIIQNQSGNKIRAYAIAFETATDKMQNGRAEFQNLTTSIWEPTQITAIEFKDSQDEPFVSVKLTVDFVEFSDGKTWGPDLHNSRDILAGQRAGAQLERQRLRQLLKRKGERAVIDDVQEDIPADLSAIAGPDHSSQWLIGFRSGMSAMRARLNRVRQSGLRAESELGKPFDTSESIPK